MQGAIEMADVRGDLLFRLWLLPSNASASLDDGFFKLANVRKQKRIRRTFRIVRVTRRCRHLDISHSHSLAYTKFGPSVRITGSDSSCRNVWALVSRSVRGPANPGSSHPVAVAGIDACS